MSDTVTNCPTCSSKHPERHPAMQWEDDKGRWIFTQHPAGNRATRRNNRKFRATKSTQHKRKKGNK